MQKVLVGMLMVALMFPAGVGAQDISRVNSPSSQQRAGLITPGELSKAVAREARRLGASRTTLSPQAQRTGQDRNWLARHPVLAGLLVGSFAGAVVGSSQCGDKTVYFGAECPAIGAGVGAGIGAGVGAVISLF